MLSSSEKLLSYCEQIYIISFKCGNAGFDTQVLEKLYRARWGPADGVGCIIITPTRELAGQIFEVLNAVGKLHGFSAGLLIGGRSDVEAEQEHVNNLNILVCTRG